ncbi:MAG: two-component regulator propeller domain-containing protein [Edaphobacter sp.]
MNPGCKATRKFAARAEKMKNLRSAMLVFVLLFVTVASVCALDPSRHISQYAHTAWRTQDGFFSAPNAITQTADGYIWIGTLNGLVRFDGIRFVSWTAPKGQSLPDTRITSILGARDGSLWIGTVSGISRLKDGEVINYSSMTAGISTIIEDHAGTIWLTRYRVSDGKGPLCRVAGKELQCYGKADGIPVNYGVGLSEDSLGNLWIGSYMLCRWRPGSSSTFFEDELKHLKGEPGVIDIAAGPSGSVWAALEGVGPKLGVRHYAEGRWTSYVAQGFDGALVRGHSLFIDRDHSLWVGGETQGLYRIHDGIADHYRSADGLSGDSVTSLYQDKEGDLWVATTGGVDFFRDTPVVNFSMHEGLSADAARSVLASSDGAVWIGNEEALNVLRGGKMEAIAARQGLPGKDVAALFEDHAHRLWIGVDQKLVIYEHGKFIDVKRSDGSVFRVDEEVSAIAEDVDQNIWVIGSHQLFRIRDQKAGEAIPLPGIRAPNWLAADPHSGVWIGSYSDKLSRYRGGHLETISLARTNALRIRNLFVDSDNSVWVATNDGLFRWHDNRVDTLDARNGLPCTSVFSVVEDNDRSLWLSTQCGLLKIAESELAGWRAQPSGKVAVKVFDALDAAQPGTADAQPKASKSPDGRLWFVNGIFLQMIDPGRLYRNSVPPPVHIEEIVADHKKYQPQDQLRLPPLTRDLEIDYTALSFPVPRRVHFRYKLDGHDRAWQEPGMRRQAFYSNLPPGKYTFHVIACNNDGVWNDADMMLNFTIAPAWYQTNWFQFLCIFSTVFIVWALHRLRMRQIAAAISARFDERLNERTQLARDLHDTLLQTIQGSKMVADDALDEPNDLMHMRHALERLSDWLGQAMQEGRAALHSLRASTTEKNDLAEAIQRVVGDCLVRGSIASSFIVEGQAEEMHPIVRDEIYRIGYEAIRNACLHSEATRMEIHLRYAQDLYLSVRDNGKGIDPEVLANGKAGHFGLQGMRERAIRIGGELSLSSSSEFGTRVELTVPGRVVFQGRKPMQSLFAMLKSIFRIPERTTDAD